QQLCIRVVKGVGFDLDGRASEQADQAIESFVWIQQMWMLGVVAERAVAKPVFQRCTAEPVNHAGSGPDTQKSDPAERTKQRAAAEKHAADHANSGAAGRQQTPPHGVVVPAPGVPRVIQADADHHPARSSLADQTSSDIAYHRATQFCTQPSGSFELRESKYGSSGSGQNRIVTSHFVCQGLHRNQKIRSSSQRAGDSSPPTFYRPSFLKTYKFSLNVK